MKRLRPLWVGRTKPKPEWTAPALTVICYTAGLFDGEGHLTNRTGAGNATKAPVEVGVSQGEKNDGERVLAELRQEWGLGAVYVRRPVCENPIRVWRVTAYWETVLFLETVLPYLRVKKRAATEALEDLRLMPRREGSKLRMVCPCCGASFERWASDLRSRKRSGAIDIPACSVACSCKLIPRRTSGGN